MSPLLLCALLALGDALSAPAPAAASPVAVSPAPVLEASVQGPRLLLDWTTPSREPARFRILHPDGRLIATRVGKRSVQGWLISLRVAGWPAGAYRVEAEAGSSRAVSDLHLP